MYDIEFKVLVGKILSKIEGSVGDEEINIFTNEGIRYRLYHEQDCCENVKVEDICGDLADLIGSPILMAEEVSGQEDPEGYKPESDYRESYTWTFYKLASIKGSVTIRFLGESNGYYSERVSFMQAEP
jgi:hypothetical protein